MLDYIIGQSSKLPPKKLKPVIRAILRLSVYQLREMDSVPKSAVVDEAVKLAAKKGFGNLKGYVNAVLRSIIRQKDDIALPDEADAVKYISVKYSMPEFIVRQWLAAYTREETEDICRSFLKDKNTAIRVRTDIENVINELRLQGISAEKSPYLQYAYHISDYDSIGKIESFNIGAITVQDVSSMLCVEAAGIKRGESVIDVCAAPGGKSLLAADKCVDGRVISRDISQRKIDLINENIQRCSVKNIQTQIWDATIFDAALEGAVDVVLVDAPCSGYGIIGRKPDIKYNASQQKQEDLAALQLRILNTAAGYVRPGGRLIFSTCTISKIENEDNVQSFLENNSDFKLFDISKNLPKDLEAAKKGYIQLLPGKNKCDGFFIAGFKKND